MSIGARLKKYKVRVADTADEMEIEAYGFREAAVEYVAAKERRAAEWSIAAGLEDVVVVVEFLGVRMRFRVFGEPVPNYGAEQV